MEKKAEKKILGLYLRQQCFLPRPASHTSSHEKAFIVPFLPLSGCPVLPAD
jgi:hypothetical protein